LKQFFHQVKKIFLGVLHILAANGRKKINKELAFEEASLLFFHLFKTI